MRKLHTVMNESSDNYYFLYNDKSFLICNKTDRTVPTTICDCPVRTKSNNNKYVDVADSERIK